MKASSTVAGSRSEIKSGHRLLDLIGNAEIEAHRIAHEARELHEHRVIEAEVAAQRLAVLDGGILADHLVHGIADIAEQRERDQGHGEHDHEPFEEPPDGECEHRLDPRAQRPRSGNSAALRILAYPGAKSYCFRTHAKRT